MKVKDIKLKIEELSDIYKIQHNSLTLLYDEMLETEVKINKLRKKLVKKNDTKVIR